MNAYPHLPRVTMFHGAGEDLAATSDIEVVPSLGKHDDTNGVVFAFSSNVDPTFGTDEMAPDGTVDFVVQGTFDGETWTTLLSVDEADFVAAADPATSFAFHDVVPYRPAYRVTFVHVNNEATIFRVVLVK